MSTKIMNNTNKGVEEIVEQMADIEHKRWSSWQKWMHECSTKNADGSLTIPADKVERWERQITTEYKDLSEEEKESDRKQVYPYLDIITSYREQGVKAEKKRIILEARERSSSHYLLSGGKDFILLETLKALTNQEDQLIVKE